MRYDIEKIGKENYIRVISNSHETRDEFACNMISEADIKGLIKLYYAPANGTDVYKYRVTDLVPLERFMEGIQDPQMLGDILEQILCIYENLGEYILKPEGLMFSKKFMYMDLKDCEVKMIYIPADKNCADAEMALRVLLLDIASSVNLCVPAIDSLTHYLSRNEVLSLMVIRSLIANLYPIEEEPVIVSEVKEKKKTFFRFGKAEGSGIKKADARSSGSHSDNLEMDVAINNNKQNSKRSGRKKDKEENDGIVGNINVPHYLY